MAEKLNPFYKLLKAEVSINITSELKETFDSVDMLKKIWHGAEPYLVLLHCCAIPHLRLFWLLLCFITLPRCSLSSGLAEAYPDSLHWWAYHKPETLLMYILFYYFAEMFPIFKRCRRLPHLLQCWALPDLKILPTYILSNYVAEMFPIFKRCDFYPICYIGWLFPIPKNCWCISWRISLLRCS